MINGTCSTMAWASLSTSVREPRAPARMPFRERLPASIQTKLSPRLCSWSSILLLPAFPMATTQINAPTPTEMPRIVRTLRSQFRIRDANASRNRALRFINENDGEYLTRPKRSAGSNRLDDYRPFLRNRNSPRIAVAPSGLTGGWVLRRF